ncbi:MAG: nuclear transport factor 2 family protein [Vicinamibacteraceae bacterium]
MEDNKAIAIRWLESVGSGDIEAFKALVTDDVVHEVMGTSVLSGVRTLDDLVELAEGLFQATKNGLRFDILDVTAEEDRVAVHFEGSSELLNGSVYNNAYHLLFRLRDGKVCRVWEYTDTKYVDEVLGPLLAQAA